MRSIHAIAIILILTLASSPALAAICATSCASHSIISSMHVEDMSGMKNCHEGSMKKDKQKSNEHKSCAMGAGCNFTQVTSPIIASLKLVFDDTVRTSFPSFVPSDKSVDLSPPLKPPA
jgi:hypothetical protein